MNSGFAYRRILSDIIAYVKTTYIIFFKKEEAQECFLSKTRIFYEMNVSVVIFIIYLYWHLFNKVLYVFHICCFRRIFFVCVCHKQEPYLKDWYDYNYNFTIKRNYIWVQYWYKYIKTRVLPQQYDFDLWKDLNSFRNLQKKKTWNRLQGDSYKSDKSKKAFTINQVLFNHRYLR